MLGPAFPRRSSFSLSAQRGLTLAVALVLLASLTLVAVFAIQRSSTQIKLVGNMQHMETARAAVSSCLDAGLDQVVANGAVLSSAINAVAREEDGSLDLDDDGELQQQMIDPLPGNLKPATVDYLNVNCDLQFQGVRRISGSSVNLFSRYAFREEGNATAVGSGRGLSRQQVQFTYDGPMF